ncbi:MAG: acetolactate synthase small subunit [Ruminococcaceae bacterium]|nr:acetolactate synthase small subunit [Oscillospiraceae bacterium]
MQRFTVAVLVRNQFGVLNRVTSMFRRRQFNITSLTVSEAESAGFSRMTVMFDGEEQTKEQLINQLYKLPDVCSIKEMHHDDSVSCELLLIKMKNEPETRGDIRDAAMAFHAKTLHYTKDCIIMQLTDETRRIDDFITLMKDYTVLEICRTGIVSLERGESTIRKTNYL